MNNRRISFITCVSDEQKYAECRYYLDRLYIPEGYSVDVISIQEASSMTAGYNAGMESSDAKYKVYLHQDVLIINKNFIADLLEVFFQDEKIGMLGVIGKKRMGVTAIEMMEWDVGKVIYDNVIINDELPKNRQFVEVSAVDGLLLATQYDISWREDVFDGWDFYDFSQCMEFKKAGYKVVVPRQEDIWCCHDGICSNLTAYYDYYERFLHEYGKDADIPVIRSSEELFKCEVNKEYAQKIGQLKEGLEGLLDAGGKEALRMFFQNAQFEKNPHLKEYRMITRIDEMEEQEQSDIHFWNTGMSASQLLSKLRTLKYALKRIEYDAEDMEKINIKENYSRYATMEVCRSHITYQDRIYEKRRDLLSADLLK